MSCSFLIAQTKTRTVKNSPPKAKNQALRLNNVLVTDNSYTPEELVSDFFNGSCVQISNVTYTGDSTQCGFFWADQTSLGVQAGIMLASGDIANAEGPNESNSTTSALYTPGDALLESLLPDYKPSYDAAVLEFDFVASKPGLSFNYVFASEEYDEWVCSPFNDVFGFFISGPGFNGEQNVAIIPNTNIPVQINTINNGNPGNPDSTFMCGPTNNNYFVSNPMGSNEIEYDGYTVPISSTFSVIPGETYHAKLAITDISDGAFDSGVLISFNSMCGDSLLNPKNIYASIKPTGLGSFAFKAKSKYSTAYHWDFGDGESSNSKEPTHTYAKEGDYKVSFIASNYCCSDTTYIDVKVSFALQVMQAEANNPTCAGLCDGNILLNVIGGKQPYTYHWSNGFNTNNLIGLCKGIYTVTVFDADGNMLTTEVELIDPKPITIDVFQTADPDLGYITTTAVFKGGTPPYSYQWFDNYPSTTRTDLKPGEGYSIKVFDMNGCPKELKVIDKPGTTKKLNAGFSGKIKVRELEINTYNLESAKAELRVFNTMGQSMWTSTITGDQSVNINAGNWSSGIYFIQMISEEGVVQKSIFIK